jgi:hypothetical protein
MKGATAPPEMVVGSYVQVTGDAMHDIEREVR